jgi:hypothetical protein
MNRHVSWFSNQSKVLENMYIVMIWLEHHTDSEHLHLLHVINIKQYILIKNPVFSSDSVYYMTIFMRRYTRCDNLIPGMALWKQNLLTCAVAAAVALEILSLWSYALRRWWCHCQKQSWKSFSRIPCSNVTSRWMSGISVNLYPFRAFFNFGKSQKSQGAKSGE